MQRCICQCFAHLYPSRLAPPRRIQAIPSQWWPTAYAKPNGTAAPATAIDRTFYDASLRVTDDMTGDARQMHRHFFHGRSYETRPIPMRRPAEPNNQAFEATYLTQVVILSTSRPTTNRTADQRTGRSYSIAHRYENRCAELCCRFSCATGPVGYPVFVYSLCFYPARDRAARQCCDC